MYIIYIYIYICDRGKGWYWPYPFSESCNFGRSLARWYCSFKKTNRIIRCFPSITSRSNKVSLRSYYITTHQSFCTFSNLFFVSHSLPGRTRKKGDLQPGDVVRLKNDSNLAFLVLIFVMWNTAFYQEKGSMCYMFYHQNGM